MAADSYGTQNQPQFAGSGAPSDAADLSQVANYAALVGNLKSDTSAVRAALTGKDVWSGLVFVETDTGLIYLMRSSGWVIIGSDPTETAVSSFSTGWGAATGAQQTPRLRRIGKQVLLYGAVKIATGGSLTSILTVPTGFQPSTTDTRFVGCCVGSNSSIYELALTAGVLGVPSGYSTGSLPNTGVLPLTCSWWMD